MRGEWYTTTSGGSGGRLIAAVVLVLLGSGAGARLSAALVAVLIALAVMLALAVVGGVAWLVYRARQERPHVRPDHRDSASDQAGRHRARLTRNCCTCLC
jgi:hypothetical protein